MKLKRDTSSYMQLSLSIDGNSSYLMVPTYFDRTQKEWLGFVQLPKAKKTIIGRGKDSTELETNFNEKLKESFKIYPEETLSLFQSLTYWSEIMKD